MRWQARAKPIAAWHSVAQGSHQEITKESL